MTSKEVIHAFGLQHLTARDVERIEEAMSSDDAETMLTLVDALVGKAKKKDRRRP